MFYPFSHRTNWPLQPNQLIAALESFREKGVDVIDLTESNPTRCQFLYPDGPILSSLLDSRNIVYDPLAQGSWDARKAVCEYYQARGTIVEPQRIILTCSTSEAYSFLFRLLVNPGEHIAVGQPSYPLFQYLIELNDAIVDYYSIVYKKKRWTIDLDSLEQIVHANTRAIILVNPNNPTGSFLTVQELAKLNDLCQKYKIALISDEVFADYAFGPRADRVNSLINNQGPLSFSLGGISKALGLPQMKLSWIVLNGEQDVMKEALKRLEIIADTYLSVNTPSQNALKDWLSLAPHIQNMIRERVMTNWNVLKQSVAAFGLCEIFDCEGGWYAILKLPSAHNEEEWVMNLLAKDHVLVYPGYFFDFKEEPYIVLSLLPETKRFQNGLTKIFKRIKANS